MATQERELRELRSSTLVVKTQLPVTAEAYASVLEALDILHFSFVVSPALTDVPHLLPTLAGAPLRSMSVVLPPHFKLTVVGMEGGSLGTLLQGFQPAIDVVYKIGSGLVSLGKRAIFHEEQRRKLLAEARKTDAEATKILAEAEKERAEVMKVRAEAYKIQVEALQGFVETLRRAGYSRNAAAQLAQQTEGAMTTLYQAGETKAIVGIDIRAAS